MDRHIVKYSKILVVFLGIILLTSFVPLQSAYSAVTFPSSFTNLSSILGTSNSETPEIASSGTNVYVVWREANDIRFVNSTDSGSTFPNTPDDIGDATTSASGNPKIKVEGNNIYTVWRDGIHINFNPSNDNGDTFSGIVQLSSSTSTSSRNPQITIDDNNDVDVVFRDRVSTTNNIILFRQLTNNGATLNSLVQIDDNSNSVSPDPQVATSGTNVHVAWQDSTDILVASSANSGSSFPTTVDVGDTLSSSVRSLPQIEASGSNVFVVWRENTDVKFSRSTNGGTSFSTPADIGDTGAADVNVPIRLVVDSSNVYVAWQDNNDGSGDIKFAVDTNNGADFEAGTVSEINLSSNTGLSTNPELAVSGTNVFVSWRDLTTDSSGDILIKHSANSGSSFASSTGVSGTAGDTSIEQKIAASGSSVFVAWKDSDPGNNDILYKTGTISPVSVLFDQSQYKLSDTATFTATITITDTSKSGQGTISATVTSSTGDTTGFSITLNEQGSSGTFSSETLRFSEILNSDSSVPRLKANPGDTITASFEGNDGTASIFDRTIEFVGGFSILSRSGIHSVVVDDQNSNQNTGSAESFDIDVTTVADPTGITLTLTETGPNTGIFGGASDPTKTQLFFFKDEGLFTLGSQITVSEEDTRAAGTPGALNTDANVFDTVTVNVNSTSFSPGINLVLNETGTDTGIFEALLTVSGNPTSTATSNLNAAQGDIVRILGQGPDSIERGLVIPNPNSPTGAIKVNTVDTITLTFKSATAQATVTDTLIGGGGGGGLVRPGLVVNVLAGVAAGGGGGLPGPTITLGAVALSDSGSEIISMPQEIRDFINDDFDPHTPLEPIIDIYEDFDLPLSINGNSFALGGYENTLVPQTVEPGKPIEFTLVFYTTFEIAHTSLNFNLGPTRTIAGSDTQVLLYKDKFEIIDPNGNIATATGSLNNDSDLKRVATFSITLSDDIQWSNSDLVIRSWNDNLNSGDIIVYDAIQVLPSEEEIAFEESIPEPEVEQLKSQYVPIWIKNNAAWWSEELIEDSDFVAGIEYLIQQEIITLTETGTLETNSSDEIPSWIKSNAGWWSEDLITEKEFIDGLQWLITNSIIKVVET